MFMAPIELYLAASEIRTQQAVGLHRSHVLLLNGIAMFATLWNTKSTMPLFYQVHIVIQGKVPSHH